MRSIHKFGWIVLALVLSAGACALGVRGADEGDGTERKKVTYLLDQFKWEDAKIPGHQNVYSSAGYMAGDNGMVFGCGDCGQEHYMIHPEEALSILLQLLMVEDGNPDGVQYEVNGNAVEIDAPGRVHQVIRQVMQSLSWAAQRQIKLEIETVELKADVVARKLGDRPELFHNEAEAQDWLQTVKNDANTTDMSARLAPGQFSMLTHEAKHREYVMDCDVQVATLACVYDPVMGEMETGLRVAASAIPYKNDALVVLELSDARLNELREVQFCSADDIKLQLPDITSQQLRVVARLQSGKQKLLAVIPPAQGGENCLVVSAKIECAPPTASVNYHEKTFALQPDLCSWVNSMIMYHPGQTGDGADWCEISGMENEELLSGVYVEDAAADCGVESSYPFGYTFHALVGQSKAVETTQWVLDNRYGGSLVDTEITGATLLARNQEYKDLSAKEDQISFALLGSLRDNAQEKDNEIRPFFIRTQLPQASFVASVRDMWYIGDYDVQVATASSIYDPIINHAHLPQGFVCDVANVQDNYIQGQMYLHSLDSVGQERMTVRLPLIGMDMMGNLLRGMAAMEDIDLGDDGEPEDGEAPAKEPKAEDEKAPPIMEYSLALDEFATTRQVVSVSCSGVSRKTSMEAGEMVQGDKQKLRVVVLTHCKMKR